MSDGANALKTCPATYLFVPGDRPERFDKAQASGADAVVLDLEDGVAPGAKPMARRAIGDWYVPERERQTQVLIRINAATADGFDDDLAVLHATGVRVAMLPKAEEPREIARVLAAMGEGAAVVPIIESAKGALNIEAIARAAGVARLAFGTLDFIVDLDMSGDERGLICTATRMAIASKAAGLASPIAGVTPSLDDDSRLAADLAFARAMGFGAKLCIHPKQVAIVNRGFAPTPAELEWAERVLAGAKDNAGAFQVDGKMVDRPVILRARSLMERAGK